MGPCPQQYHQEHPHAAWAAYVGLGRSDPVLLGIDDEAKDRQMEHIMNRIIEVTDPGNQLEPDVERDLRIVIHAWLANGSRCAGSASFTRRPMRRPQRHLRHSLLDAITRVNNIPEQLAKAVAPTS